jgi:uncharacterized protein with von Willebrand factor type A (vWA) domain
MTMPHRFKQSARIYIPVVAGETAWIESDSYDRRAWRDLSASAKGIVEMVLSGENLIPHFASLLQDIFLALFKYNIVWLKPDAVRRSAALNRAILESLVPSAAFEALKSRALLEEEKAAIAAIVLGEQVIEMMRSEKLINRRDMLELFDLQHQEQELEERAQALKSVVELERRVAEEQAPQENPEQGEPKAQSGDLARKIEQLKEAARHAAQVSEAKLNQKTRRLDDTLEQINRAELKRLQLTTAAMTEQIDQAALDTHDFSLEFGQAGRLSAGERLELGRHLAKNKRLGELARLVGRLKQNAKALRRKTLDRGPAEVYDIERGSDLGRLIPSELTALHQPALARDFKRRLLEGAVHQYQLRIDEQKGKGPMIVCVDVSSSMQGEKELWAKAVTLTLMDIARRQRRLFRAILFSSGDGSLKVLDLNRKRRYEPELAKVMELAEYFAGGGTDFERPLDAAVELLGEKRLQRGDIVFITDGECSVAPEWLESFRDRKDELQFSVYAILIDLGSSELSTLAQFSDRVTSIKRLNEQGAGEIFLNI